MGLFRKSLSLFKNLHRQCKHLWLNSKIETKRVDLRNHSLPVSKKRYDLILFGFSLNEIVEGTEQNHRTDWILKIKSLLSRNGIAIFVEPAQIEICNSLQLSCASIANREKDLFIHAPYFNNLPCPFITNETKHYYSHEVRKILSSPIIDKINGPLKLEMNQVKFGLSIIGKNKPHPFPENEFCCRLVSPIRKRKGTVSFIGIATDGQEYFYEFQRRNLISDQTKSLTKLERGDIVKIYNLKKGKDPKRIRIASYDDLESIFSPRWSD